MLFMLKDKYTLNITRKYITFLGNSLILLKKSYFGPREFHMWVPETFVIYKGY